MSALQHIEEQTPELCLAAVRQNGWALEYVKEQTPEICLAAVREHGLALHFVKEKTRELYLAGLGGGWLCGVALHPLNMLERDLD